MLFDLVLFYSDVTIAEYFSDSLPHNTGPRHAFHPAEIL